MRLPTLFLFCVSIPLLIASDTSAQGRGARHFNNDTFLAIGQTADVVVYVSAAVGESPDGPSQIVNLILITFDVFRSYRCGSQNPDLVISNGRQTLSFVTEGTLTCPAGEEITVTCEPMLYSGTLRQTVNGVLSFFGTGEHFTTHGVSFSASGLTCTIHAFGRDYEATGDVNSHRLIATP